MVGPGDGIAAVISTPALDTDLTMTRGQLTSGADNHASATTTANDAPSQDTVSRSITPIPPRKKLRSADDRLLNRACPVMIRTANPCQLYTQANNILAPICVICTASLHGSQVEVYELRRNGVHVSFCACRWRGEIVNGRIPDSLVRCGGFGALENGTCQEGAGPWIGRLAASQFPSSVTTIRIR